MTVLNLQVAASGDDGWDRGGSFTNSDMAQASGDFFGSTSCFQRFTNVTIPQGATISSAVLSLEDRDDAGNGAGYSVLIKGGAVDNPSAASIDTHAEFAAFARTTANVAWVNPTWVGGYNAAPDIASVIQEIVNRAGWASGNALIIFIDDNGSTGSSYRNGQSYDASALLSPTLDITYTVPSSGPPAGSLGLTGVGR